jgi:hypothetical protein
MENTISRQSYWRDGEIIDANNIFILIPVGPFGELFDASLKTQATGLATFSQDRPHATQAAELVITNQTLFNVFGKADEWIESHA